MSLMLGSISFFNNLPCICLQDFDTNAQLAERNYIISTGDQNGIKSEQNGVD